ncbi:MAG: 50S ribosomal protein L9 [Candidatus Zixiibacteriota bacterium]
MKVILRQDVADLGTVGQVIDVKDGYGRNFLIPRNLAIPATKGSLSAIDEVKKQAEFRSRKLRKEADVVKERVEKLSLTAEVLVGEEDKVFGSVTSADIAALLEKEGITVDKRMVELENPIKALGVYTVPVKVAKDVLANVKLWVVKKT